MSVRLIVSVFAFALTVALVPTSAPAQPKDDPRQVAIDKAVAHLKKTQNERAFVYRPAQPQRQVIGAMVRDFVNRVFNGSAEPLLVHLVEEHNLSREDLDEISRLREESRNAPRGRNEVKR